MTMSVGASSVASTSMASTDAETSAGAYSTDRSSRLGDSAYTVRTMPSFNATFQTRFQTRFQTKRISVISS